MKYACYNKIKILKYTNNNYIDVCNYFLWNPYLLHNFVLFSHKIVSSHEK